MWNFRLLLAVTIAAVLLPCAARASCGALPNTFTNNVSIVDASTTNANNNHLQSCATTVDNTQIGASGIYASQIIPTTAGQATFGGTVGYTFNPNTTGQTPIIITNAASPTVDYLEVNDSAANKLVYIDKNGNFYVNKLLVLEATGINTIISNSTGANPAFVMNDNNASAPTGDVLDLQIGGVNKFIVPSTGILATTYGGTGASSLSGANIAVTNADNAFSASQSVTGHIGASTYLYAGAATGSNTTGDISASRSASSGLYDFGTSGSKYLDYGISTAGVFTFNGGNVAVANGTVSGTHNACTASSGLPCSVQTNCAISSGTTCSVTAAVPTGSICSSTYDSATTLTPVSDLIPVLVGVASTTLTTKADTTASLSGTAYMDSTCD